MAIHSFDQVARVLLNEDIVNASHLAVVTQILHHIPDRHPVCNFQAAGIDRLFDLFEFYYLTFVLFYKGGQHVQNVWGGSFHFSFSF